MQNFSNFSKKCKIFEKLQNFPKFSKNEKIFQKMRKFPIKILKFFKNFKIFQNFVTFKTLFWPWRRHYNILLVRTIFVEKRKVNWPGKNSKFQTKYHKTRVQSILNMAKFWKNFFQKMQNFKKCKFFPNSQKCKIFQNFPKIAKFSKNCKIFPNFPKNEIIFQTMRKFPIKMSKIFKIFKIFLKFCHF